MGETSNTPKGPRRPQVDAEAASVIAERCWGVTGVAELLPGDRDMNFRVGGDAETIVLKITDAPLAEVELSVAALERLAGAGGALAVGAAVPGLGGGVCERVSGADGRSHNAWAVRWVDGCPLAHAGVREPGLLGELGGELGIARRSLQGWDHPALDRGLKWDLRRGLEVGWGHEGYIAEPLDRRVVRESLAAVEVAMEGAEEQLRVGVIHGDANDHNLLVRSASPAAGPCGLLDVGDIDRSWILGEVAIGAAYLMLAEEDPVAAFVEFVSGYHKADPIPAEELAFVMDLARLRLCVSVSVAARQRAEEPGNEYLSVSYEPALRLLRELQRVDRATINESLAEACGLSLPPQMSSAAPELLRRRAERLAPNLSLSYEAPLEMVRGEGRYLFDRGGRAYLDGVNNVPHVGHSHPAVVEAATLQMRRLNTNTRYLSEGRLRFVERLLSTLPKPLEVVYLVNSGSEANELARRLVKAHTRADDWIVLEAGYHGNTQALVDLSAYKFNGDGGGGRPEHVAVAALPDRYRGQWGYEVADAGALYAGDVARCVDGIVSAGRRVGAFLAESIPGCAGQVVLPSGYLSSAYEAVRAAGGLAVADEVQVGCGRVGTHWWGFETQGVVPDLVTIGKPLGNGHPLGAVVTTREVARSFDGGMEYFNTFGGNPVSCAAGEAVLRVIEEEGLMGNAVAAGARLLEGLGSLMEERPCIGDVRGLGLYAGVVCVTDRESREPDADLARRVVEGMLRRGVLLSTDGPAHDVIKMKPPITFLPEDAVHLVRLLGDSFDEAACHV